MKNMFLRFISNKHTSAAAIIYAVAAFGIPLLQVWWKGHDAQLDSTRRTLEAMAVFYGFAAAGDAGANVAGQTPLKPTEPPKTP